MRRQSSLKRWRLPGMLMVTGFPTRGRMGRYDDALNLAALTEDTPDTALVRHYASRPGVGLNLERQIVPNVGVFGRLGWADGDVEPYEFADIDRTAAAGLQEDGGAVGVPLGAGESVRRNLAVILPISGRKA